MKRMNIVILGLSITSSWGNGHATTYRGLVRELSARGHRVIFLERDVPWYRANRDLPHPPYGRTELYPSPERLKQEHEAIVREADLVIVGSYVPDGTEVGRWVQATAEGVTAFYDIDTPVTLSRLKRGDCEYLTPDLIPGYDLYLSFTGGPALETLERQFGAPAARPLYCSVDPELYFPMTMAPAWDLGYLGTYAEDRQPALDELLLEPARRWREGRFVVAGPMYPDTVPWGDNVTRIEHLPPAEHRRFYNSQRLTLNVTRADMVRLGHSPSVRLFEAAACGVPIVTDRWEGLDEVFDIGREILVADTSEDMLGILHDIEPCDLRRIGRAARQRVLAQHTAGHRAAELEGYVEARLGNPTAQAAPDLAPPAPKPLSW